MMMIINNGPNEKCLTVKINLNETNARRVYELKDRHKGRDNPNLFMADVMFLIQTTMNQHDIYIDFDAYEFQGLEFEYSGDWIDKSKFQTEIQEAKNDH